MSTSYELIVDIDNLLHKLKTIHNYDYDYLIHVSDAEEALISIKKELARLRVRYNIKNEFEKI